MSPLVDWVIARRYGYGAGRAPVRPPTWSCPASARPLREGIAEASRERRAAGEPSLAGRTLRGSPPFIAVVAMALALAVLLGEGPDDPDLRIVPFEPETAPTVVASAPEPEPPTPDVEEPPPPPPPPEPPPPAAPEPEPPPQPQEPQPEPPPRAAPRPQIDHLASAPQQPAPPPEPRRVEPKPRPPMPAMRPDLAIDQVAAEDPNEHRPSRSERAAPRFAAATAARPRPSVAPVAPGPEIAEAPPTRRDTRRAPPRVPSEARPAPRLALAGAPVPAAPGEVPPTPVRTRAAPRTTPSRRKSRAVGPITPATSGAGSPNPAPTRPTRGAAPARPSSPSRASSRGGSGRDIPGVPLGSLAACVSDRKEVELVKRVVASVDDRDRCESNAGRYHFVETRNVNAFLMWIERTGSRAAGDRCTELTLALDCLAKQPPARSRR